MSQIFIDSKNKEQLRQMLEPLRRQRVMLVAGSSYSHLPLCAQMQEVIDALNIDITSFSAFSSNPSYEQVLSGINCFQRHQCRGILAVGGGSAIDTAKCIKLFSIHRSQASEILFLAVPTTAGTGSESTQFAVIYKDGEKCSVDDIDALPQYVLLDAENLLSLPLQIKRSAAGDALSHAVESFWSLKASDQSKALSETAIQMLLANMDGYWQNDIKACENMLKAANLAGQAINITRTTAAHAMCYKFTSLFSIPHGHAVMLCLPEVWQYMQEHLDDCRDQRGAGYLSDTLKHLSHCFGKRNTLEAIDFIKELRIHLDFSIPPGITDEQIEVMTNSVNEQRLGNFPVVLQHENIKELYKQIIRGRK